MSDFTTPQTAEDLLQIFNHLPLPEKVRALSQMHLEELTEIYKDRVIQVYLSPEGWMSHYGFLGEDRTSEGFVYETAIECLETTRMVINWEIEHEDICNEFRQLIQKFEAKNYTQARILLGLRETLAEFNWNSEALMFLEKAADLLRLPNQRLP